MRIPGAGRLIRAVPRRRAEGGTGYWGAWLAAAAMLVVAAGALPSLSLFALAIALVLAVAGALAAVSLAARRLVVTRSVPVPEAREDEPLLVRYEVGLPSWLPVLLEVRTGEGEWIPLLRDGGTVELFIGRRGAHLLGPSRVRLSDPLGIRRRAVSAGGPVPVLILPVPDTGLAPALPQGARADDPEPDGLRPYQPGTPISRVHWPSLARGGGLYERRFAAPPTGVPLVIVDTAGAADPRALDWVARAAAGCVLRLTRAGGCEVALPGDAAPTAVVDEGGWRAVHRRLALLDSAWQGRAPGSADRTTSVIRVPSGLDLGPPPPALPPGVEPMSAEEALAMVTAPASVSTGAPVHRRRSR